MKTYEELLHTKEFWLVKIQNKLYAQLEEYMTNKGLTRKALGDHLGFSKGYISQVLNGESDHRLSKLVDLSLSIGLVPLIDFESIDQYIEKEKKISLLEQALLENKPMFHVTYGGADKVEIQIEEQNGIPKSEGERSNAQQNLAFSAA